MFTFFSKEKIHYEKGQIFPFLIAMICVVVIMVMITINLGQINIFKTETSNAADAGALAAPSVLSGTLLGFGLQSETMFGKAVAVILAIAVAMAIPIYGWIISILIYIAFIVSQFVDYAMAFGQGQMGWSNAKKTAMSYAFQNIGVNERRKDFREFLQGVYGFTPDQQAAMSAADIAKYNSIYLQGVDPVLNCGACPKDAGVGPTGCGLCAKIRQYTQTGFSRFMQDGKNGFWPYGDITPGSSTTGQGSALSGYGWNNDGNSNSYDKINGIRTPCFDAQGKLNFDNAVQVRAVGATVYAIKTWSLLDDANLLKCLQKMLIDAVVVPWWLGFMADPVTWIVSLCLFWLMESSGAFDFIFPMGLDFIDNNALHPDNSYQQGTVEQTSNNQIMVTVKRLKKDNDLGLWKFRYGTSGSSALSHVFPEHFCVPYSSPKTGCYFDTTHFETIAPVVFAPLLSFLSCPSFTNGTLKGSWDDPRRHLFETELQEAY